MTFALSVIQLCKKIVHISTDGCGRSISVTCSQSWAARRRGMVPGGRESTSATICHQYHSTRSTSTSRLWAGRCPNSLPHRQSFGTFQEPSSMKQPIELSSPVSRLSLTDVELFFSTSVIVLFTSMAAPQFL